MKAIENHIALEGVADQAQMIPDTGKITMHVREVVVDKDILDNHTDPEITDQIAEIDETTDPIVETDITTDQPVGTDTDLIVEVGKVIDPEESIDQTVDLEMTITPDIMTNTKDPDPIVDQVDLHHDQDQVRVQVSIQDQVTVPEEPEHQRRLENQEHALDADKKDTGKMNAHCPATVKNHIFNTL